MMGSADKIFSVALTDKAFGKRRTNSSPNNQELEVWYWCKKNLEFPIGFAPFVFDQGIHFEDEGHAVLFTSILDNDGKKPFRDALEENLQVD